MTSLFVVGVEFLERVKRGSRIKNGHDEEVKRLIHSARLDLQNAGIKKDVSESEVDALIETAVILYVQSMFGIGNDKRERDIKLYEQFKISLKNSNHGVENE